MCSKRILLVEDEFLVGLNVQTTLTEAGFEVTGPAVNEKTALKYLDADGFDAAVLDVNLGGHLSSGIASRLTDQGIPFVLLTGYDRETLPDELTDAPLIEKPFDRQMLIDTILGLCCT